MSRVQLNFDKKRMSGAYGLTMEDGTRYTANSRGQIEVENKAHLKAISKHAKVDMRTDLPTGFRDLASRSPSSSCDACGFIGWKWQTVCPRCGGTMSLETQ